MKKSDITVVMAQLNPITGDIEYNKTKAIEAIKKANEIKADLIVFPELFLLGNPFGDILAKFPKIADNIKKALDEISKYADYTSVLIGYPEINEDKSLDLHYTYYNSVAFLKNRKIEKVIRKSVLKDCLEHSESRCFKPYKADKNARIININNKINAFVIFENELSDNDLEISIKDINCAICPASSCSRTGKEQIKRIALSNFSKKHNIKLIYVNHVGASEELIFDGMSRMYDEKGELKALAKIFEEDFYVLNLEKGGVINPLLKGLELNINQKEFSFDYEYDLERTYKAIIFAIKEYFSKNGLKRAVLGLSGGLDSTICSVLLADALGSENVLGVSMPSKITSSESKSDAKTLADNLGINFIEVPIKDIQDVVSSGFEKIFSKAENFWNFRYKNSYTQDNIQARTRATILWGIANEFSSTIPIATSDKSEAYMGYATINGDMSGGYAPISDVVKTKLFALARWMNENRKDKNAIPNSVIMKPPGAELAINPNTGKPLTAEEALMPYEFLDEVIWRIENLNQSIDNMMKSTFLYEKNNVLDNDTKLKWLNKFFKRMKGAIYKWYIIPPGPVIDSHSINKIEFRQPIVSNINYS